MLYSINEIFYSIQGEGRNTGMPAWFIRFAGCNLSCSWCDTDYSIKLNYQEKDILEEINENQCKNVVLTGGEPALQNLKPLLLKLKEAGYYVAIETNGTRELLQYRIEGLLDWVAVSPKELPINVDCVIDEIKVVWPSEIMEKPDIFNYLEEIPAFYYYLQPRDDKLREQNEQNINVAVNIIKANPKWRLSLQTHKILQIK